MSFGNCFIQFMTVRNIRTNILVTKLSFKKWLPEFMNVYHILEMGISLRSNLGIYLKSLAILGNFTFEHLFKRNDQK